MRTFLAAHSRTAVYTALASAVLLGAALLKAQAPSPTAPRGSYSAPRTPWGDPDLQGTYTNSDESGTPMSRPDDLAGRKPDEVTAAEMARLAKERAARIEKTAEVIGGTEDNNTGAGPSHWYENYNPRNSRPWMVLDGPDYQVPPTTQEAKDRAAALRAARGGGDGYYVGPFRGPEEFTPYVRCITRGVPGSMMPAIYGNSYDITQSPGFVAIRYEMVHETRVIPLDGRPHASGAIRSNIGDARGRWEGDTLVVETDAISAEFFDYEGTPQGADARYVERFVPTDDSSRLNYRITVVDPATFTETLELSRYFVWRPELVVNPYDCFVATE
jgi:hypothetical protein